MYMAMWRSVAMNCFVETHCLKGSIQNLILVGSSDSGVEPGRVLLRNLCHLVTSVSQKNTGEGPWDSECF